MRKSTFYFSCVLKKHSHIITERIPKVTDEASAYAAYTVHKKLSGIIAKLHHNVTFPNTHVALFMPEDISDTIPLQFSKY